MTFISFCFFMAGLLVFVFAFMIGYLIGPFWVSQIMYYLSNLLSIIANLLTIKGVINMKKSLPQKVSAKAAGSPAILVLTK